MKVVDVSKHKDNLSILIYGASGTGKTNIVATAAELGKVLVADLDKGTVTFTRPHLSKYLSKIQVVEIEFPDVDKLYKAALVNTVESWRRIGIETDQPFKTLVFDTYSEAQWLFQKEIRRTANKLGNGLAYRKNMEIQEWGSLTDFNKLVLTSFREVPMTVVFTMHEVLDKDEVSGAIYGGPAIHGKLVTEIPKYFDIVARTFVDLQGKYSVTTKAANKWTAKTRVGEGRIIPNPTFKDLLE